MKSLEKYLKKSSCINITELKQYLEAELFPHCFSYNTIKKTLKSSQKAVYRTMIKNYADKNRSDIKEYRQFLCRLIVKEMNSDNVFISLDETSISSAHQSIIILDNFGCKQVMCSNQNKKPYKSNRSNGNINEKD